MTAKNSRKLSDAASQQMQFEFNARKPRGIATIQYEDNLLSVFVFWVTQEEEETTKTPKKARFRPQSLQMPIIQVSDTFIVKKLQIREEKASAIIQISP